MAKGNQAIQINNAPPSQEDSLLQAIISAASNPNVDVAKMESLLAMQERILAHKREMAFNEAMEQLEPRLPVIRKTGYAEFKQTKYSYAKYEEIDYNIRPLLREFGFQIYFTSTPLPNGVTEFTGHLKHKEGHVRTASLPLPPEDSGSKNRVQAVGSTSTYARRYTVCMLLNLITSDMADDDAQRAGSEFATPEQVASLESMIANSGYADTAKLRSRLLGILKAETFDNITVEQYVVATQRIADVLKNLKQG